MDSLKTAAAVETVDGGMDIGSTYESIRGKIKMQAVHNYNINFVPQKFMYDYLHRTVYVIVFFRSGTNSVSNARFVT